MDQDLRDVSEKAQKGAKEMGLGFQFFLGDDASQLPPSHFF